jgi:hypothetical protein
MTNARPRGRFQPSRKPLQKRYRAATFAAGLMLFVSGCGSMFTSIPFTNTPLPPQTPGPQLAYPSLAEPAPKPVDPKPVLSSDQQKEAESALEKAATEREDVVRKRLERAKN